MDEWVDIVNEEGLPTGQTVKKSEAHRNGWLHPTVHVWAYSEQGEILLQLRSSTKSTFASKWDVSVAGHIGAGEAPIFAALREIKEEIGLNVHAEDLEKIGLFKSVHHHGNGIVDAELHHTYMVRLNPKTISLVPEAEEVEALKWWPMESLIKAFDDPETRQEHVPHDHHYFQTVMRAIREGL